VRAAWWGVGVGVMLAACAGAHERDDDPSRPDGGSRRDAADDRDGGPPPAPVETVWRFTDGREVDLLFVIDDSISMVEEQASLAVEVPRLVYALTMGDLDSDGMVDVPPASTMQVGVISTDMGTGGHAFEGCAEPSRGADGVLADRLPESVDVPPLCTRDHPRVTAFDAAAGDDPGRFAHEATCATMLGYEGCNVGQPLEALLKALTPASSTVRFAGDLPGHGDGVNAGFLREDSVLAIVVITDEDDCSLADQTLLDPTSSEYTEPREIRCALHPEALHPVERYLALALPGQRVVFVLFAGVPVDLIFPVTDYGAILADERMTIRVESGSTTRLAAACNVPGRGVAAPARRLVTFARQLADRGAHALVGSICQTDWGFGLNPVLEAMDEGPAPRCHPTRPRDATGRVGCELIADGVPVPQQVPSGAGSGWWWDDSGRCPPGRGRVAFASGAEPRVGALLRLICRDGIPLE
jgi:hypothetical protein